MILPKSILDYEGFRGRYIIPHLNALKRAIILNYLPENIFVTLWLQAGCGKISARCSALRINKPISVSYV